MIKDYKKILSKKFKFFNLEENPERKRILGLEMIKILLEIQNPDSNDFYHCGLVYYLQNEDENLNLALEKFIKSYDLDSNNFMACLYIAHCFHDNGSYEEALKYYKLVNKEALKKFQKWRYVKLIEQIGFCNYKLGNQELGRKQFKEVLEWYRKLPIDELVSPYEMFQCLSESDKIVIEIKEIEEGRI
jgi:tetratricopeptide (TPR) repeat protein